MASRAGVAFVLAVFAAGIVGLFFAGRWERSRAIGAEVRGIERVRATIGPSLDVATLDDYYLTPPLTDPQMKCLRYRAGNDPYALQLCFDLQGRLIEAIDERSGEARIWSLRWDPGATRTRVSLAAVDALILQLQKS